MSHDEPVKIKLRHYSYHEGQEAVRLGYSGPNPYRENYSPQGKVCRAQWEMGYIDALVARLKEGKSAIGEKTSD